MSRFYILTYQVEDDELSAMLDGTLSCEDDINKLIYQDTSILQRFSDKEISFLVAKYTLRGNMDDLLNIDDLQTPVVTERTISLFREIGISNIEYIPLVIKDDFYNYDDVEMANLQSKELDYKSINYNHFFLLNILNHIDCIDHTKSTLEYYMPQASISEDMPENMKQVLQTKKRDYDVDFIQSLIFNESKIPNDIKIFRLKDCPRLLIFKEDIVKSIKEANLTGFIFIPLEEYTELIPDEDDITSQDTDIILPKEVKPITSIQQERKEAYREMQERIRIRREAGEGTSLI